MGILLLGCLLFLLYQSFVKEKDMRQNDHIWLGAAALLTVMSLRYFPWILYREWEAGHWGW